MEGHSSMSQQQDLSHLAAIVKQLAASAVKNQRLTIEAGLKRNKMLIDLLINWLIDL